MQANQNKKPKSPAEFCFPNSCFGDYSIYINVVDPSCIQLCKDIIYLYLPMSKCIIMGCIKSFGLLVAKIRTLEEGTPLVISFLTPIAEG